ncbi:hypothetical protein LOK49_LG06G00914 [Camellia lanceoleosa]|uniref:Uncharacterized protein n=1 Tax=Camellia lanceoleosa TaxID=1840588 RepID=A0ACC0HGK0_9ERIC|nr:hypothetical protein LOK49_LG06G00914 [Camellia lanceoleosa]
MKEAKLEMEKRKVLELQMEVPELEIQVLDSNHRIGTLVEELEIAKQKKKMHERIIRHVADVSERDQEIKKLNFALKQLAVLEARVEESELRSNSLENEIRQCENGLSSEIEQRKANTSKRSELVEALNKKLDMLKLKYDMAVAEKDGFNAKTGGDGLVSSYGDPVLNLRHQLINSVEKSINEIKEMRFAT